MKFDHWRAACVAGALAFGLAGCSGSGAGNGGPPPTPLPTSVTIESAAQAETGAPVDFHTDLAPPPAGLAFLWDFGDGTTSDSPSAQHVFAASGDYTVTLSIDNTAGLTRQWTTHIAVGLFSNVAGLNCSGASHTGWCWQDVLVTGHEFGAIDFVDALHGWAVGKHGAIAATTDGGATWRLQPSPNVDDLAAVRLADPLHGWAMGPLQGIQTSDGGLTWTANTIGGATHWDYSPTLASADPASVAITTFTGSGTTVSHDNGLTWERTSLNPYNGVTMAPNGDCWTQTNLVVYRAAGCSGVVTSAALAHPADFQGFSSPVFVADATHARITSFGYSQAAGAFIMLGWETADGGASWAAFTPTGAAGKASNQQMYGDAGWTQPTGGGTTLLHTTDGGHSWTTLAPPVDCIGYCGVLSGSFDGSNAWMSSRSELAITHDAGATWQQVLIPAQYGGFGAQVLVASADGQTLLVDMNARVLLSRDAGATWTRTLGRDPVDGLGSGAAVHMASGKTGLALSSNGVLRTTTDGGQTWSHRYLPVALADRPVDVHLSDASNGWVLFQGQLQSTSDGGAHLGTPLSGNHMTGLVKMDWSDGRHGAVVDGSGVASLTQDGGTTWRSVDALSALGSGRVLDLVLVSASSGVARLDDGTLATTSDFGATWTRTVTLPAEPYGVGLRSTGAGGVWILGSAPQRSDDNGATWRRVTLANANVNVVVDVAFADALHGWLLADGGQVLATGDGGTTWSTLALGADVALARLAVADRATAWIATTAGPLLATASGGR